MNTAPRFRYYLALVLLALLGFAVRVQSTAGPEGVRAVPPTTMAAHLYAE